MSLRLFIALWPSPSVRRSVADTAAWLRGRHQLPPARWVDAVRYHATLVFLGNFARPAPAIVEAATAALAAVELSPFVWTLDLATSFPAPRPPWVLTGRQMPTALPALRQSLWQILQDSAGLPMPMRPFVPHLTIAYGRRERLPTLPVPAVHWQVDTLVLAASQPDRRDYVHLAERRLSG